MWNPLAVRALRTRKSLNREPVWDSCADTKGSERRPDAQVAGVCVTKFVYTWKKPGGKSSGSWLSGQPCVSALAWDTHACARSLKTQHLKYLRKCADQFHMVQDIALISARCRNAAGWTHAVVLETSGLQAYPDSESSTPDWQLSICALPLCISRWPIARLKIWKWSQDELAQPL